MKKISFLVFIFSVVMSVSAQAAWTGKQTVHRVYTSSDAVYVQTYPSTAHINPSGCVTKSDYRLDTESVMFEKQYQMLLTGLAAGKKISFSVLDCIGNHPKIHSLIIYN